MTCWMWSLFNTCLWNQLWTVCDSSGKAQKGCILSVFEEEAAVLCQHFSLLYFDCALGSSCHFINSLHGLHSWDLIYSMEYGDNERDTGSYLKVQSFQATCAFCQQIKGLSGQQWEEKYLREAREACVRVETSSVNTGDRSTQPLLLTSLPCTEFTQWSCTS